MTDIMVNWTQIMIISAVTSKIALLAFFLILLKYVSKKLAKTGNKTFKKADKAFMKTHNLFGWLMIVFALIHGICSVYSIPEKGALPFIIGVICFIACLTAIGSFYYRKKMEEPKRWIQIHRISTVIALVTLIAHIAVSKGLLTSLV